MIHVGGTRERQELVSISGTRASSAAEPVDVGLVSIGPELVSMSPGSGSNW